MRKLIVDSGAFSVWSCGKKIDIEDYIDFCQQHPKCTCFICLDAIPGKRGQKFPSGEEREYAAEQSWKNYQRMIRELPVEKVMAVYHQGESTRWLEKYLDFGVAYLGIGTNQNLSSKARYGWIDREVKPIVASHRELPMKIHALGMVSESVMKIMEWDSFDSTSWLRVGGFGQILLPRMCKGRMDYSYLWKVSVTERAFSSSSGGLFRLKGNGKAASKKVRHYTRLTPYMRKVFDLSLDRHNQTLGGPKQYRHEEDTSSDGIGLVTSRKARDKMNYEVTCLWAETLSSGVFYAAGVRVPNPELEFVIDARLLSYFYLLTSENDRKVFDFHYQRLGG
ncbi:MAG: tRNA guanosine transglycosylase family protein [Candidatus Methanospirareceae archaeon]